MNEKELQISAIKKVLDKLYYEKKLAFNHDCARCGELYNNKISCNKCKDKDKKLLEEKIPYWENKLKEVLDNEE